MNKIAKAIESFFGADGDDHCDVWLCSSEGNHQHVFNIDNNHFEREYCEGHFQQLTGVMP